MALSDGRLEAMTKAELVEQVALKTELTKKQTAKVVDLFLQCIIEALQAGDVAFALTRR